MGGVKKRLKASRWTTCPDCGEDTGVQPDFNTTINRRGADFSVWRIALHGSPRCTAGRMIVPASAVIFRNEHDWARRVS